jgi:hypothetical protein
VLDFDWTLNKEFKFTYDENGILKKSTVQDSKAFSLSHSG